MKRENQEQTEQVKAIITRLEGLGFVVTNKPEYGESCFMLNDEMVLDIAWARLNYRREYIFTFDKGRFEYFFSHHRHFFQLLLCESSERVFILPLSLILEINHDIFAQGSDFKAFKPIIKLRNGVWWMRFFGQYDITDYLNRYDFLISESKTYRPQTTRYNSVIEIPTLQERLFEYATEGGVRTDSLHSATVDMLRKIGEMSGFEVITESKPLNLPDFPYQIDCLWYKGGDLYLAVEVCHHGVVEKDKDALKMAKQHGARKVIIVTEINKMERVRKLFALEGDLKAWTEIWSFERVFGLYDSGIKFFKDFEKFKRYGWSENLNEFI